MTLRRYLLSTMVGLVAADCTTAHTWSPLDSLSIQYVASSSFPQTLEAMANDDLVNLSPDGKKFFVITTRADVRGDAKIYEIRVFRTDDVLSYLAEGAAHSAPMVTAYRSAVLASYSSHHAAIDDASWDEDSRGVVFHGLTETGERGVYYFSMESGDVRRWIADPHEIRWFHAGSGALLFKDTKWYVAPPTRYPMEPMAWDSPGVLATPDRLTAVLRDEGTYAVREGNAPVRFGGDLATLAWIAPDGHRAIGVRRNTDASYFVLLDLDKGLIRPLLDAPVGALNLGSKASEQNKVQLQYKALWSADGAHVALVNTRVPGKEFTSPNAYLVDYEIGTDRWRVLEPIVAEQPAQGASQSVKYVSETEWLESGRQFAVRHSVQGKVVDSTTYQVGANGWEARRDTDSGSVSKAASLTVTVRQSMNDPPMLIASNGRHEVALSAPDPALAHVKRMPMSNFQWTGPLGQKRIGGLTLPPNYRPGHPVPLVIQAYMHFPELFLPDGPHKASDATQSLAARGIAVLEAPFAELEDGDRMTRMEGPAFVAELDAVVDALAKQGIIDPLRVGLTGFSRMGYRTLLAITRPGKVRIAAAICDDSFTGSYGAYLQDGAKSAKRASTDFERAPGGTFWDHKTEWLEHEPTFNVDRVTTPTLFTQHAHAGDPRYHPSANDPYTALALDIIGAFNLTKRPIEYLFFPSASHELERPLEQLTMMEVSVDWMDFWLQGREDPRPDKVAQYSRWRPLRKQLAEISVRR
jgi:dipeptidyl aminopeptidase/acylaminoacyl peptidase